MKTCPSEKACQSLSAFQDKSLWLKSSGDRQAQCRIAANEEIANDDNEQPEVRERPLEKVEEEIQNVVALEEQNEKLREKLLLRERVKEIFKRCGLTLTTVILAA